MPPHGCAAYAASRGGRPVLPIHGGGPATADPRHWNFRGDSAIRERPS
ncbi:hypothetical protein BBSC_1921 [Bifidobacterium scardovii JCM 12489 = DSM 13734]|nr:hypothetical protein BBSC_1921 [Bifidobacterium scardovii JCM 12489 = DSM 13734]